MSTVDEVKARLDVVDVVSSYVALKKAGSNHKGLCPFHTEKTPSFTVNQERQSWRCFGACSTGGDVISFVMRAEKIEFGDALRKLADRAGVQIKERRQDGERYDILYRINQEAARFYHDVLKSDEGRVASKYISGRGLDDKVISLFGLGASPRDRQRLKTHLTTLGISVDQAVEAGVLRRGEDGSVRDFFGARLMIPIHDRRGRVVGFGGRSLDGSDPKYINTAASPIFDKRANLYGLNLAAGPIRDGGTAVVVEGYMDAIAAHQHGYTNVVACMGTALTEQQVSQLRGMAKTVVQALDPDEAGQEATRRSLTDTYRALARRHLGQRADLELRVASLPHGRDPDALIRKNREEWERLTREAVPYMEFLIPTEAARFDLNTPEGKAEAAEALWPVILDDTNSFNQEQDRTLLAKVLGVSPEALEASMGRLRTPTRRRARPTPARSRDKATTVSALSGDLEDYLEDYLVALLLDQRELKEKTVDVPAEHFRRTENREVFTSWQSCNTMEELREVLDESLQQHVEYLVGLDLGPLDRPSAEGALKQCLVRLEQRHLREQQEGLLATEDSALPPPRELEEPIVTANSRLRELFSQ